jgi:PAS domain S-box-containing protein
MEDRDKTKQQLVNELIEERGRSAELKVKLRTLGQTQEALRMTEERLERALDGAEVGLWDYNLKTGEAFISPQRAAMIGYSVDELEPHFSAWGKLVHPEDIGRVTDAFNAHVQGHTPLYQCEHRLRTKSGEYLWILARAKVVEWDEDGSPVRIVGTSLDISDRKRADEALQKAHNELERRVEERTAELANANQQLKKEILERKNIEEALRDSEEKFRSVVQTSLEGVCVVQDATLKLVNPSIAMFLGCTADELIGKRFTDFIHTDDSEAVFRRYSEQLAGQKQRLRFNFRAVDKAGNVKWLDGGTALISWEGKPAISLFAIDISQRKRVEEALQESEKRYRELVEKANDMIYLTDANGHFLVFNAVGMKITGYSQEEIVQKHYLAMIHPDYRDQVERFYGLQFVKRIPDTYYEAPIVSHEGKTVWIGQNVHLVMEGDTVVGFQAICRDITDRKRAEDELRASEERLELALSGADLGSWDWNLKTGYAVWNERASRMLGYLPGEVQTNLRTWKDLVHPEDWPRVSEVLNSHLEGRVSFIELEYRLRCKSGEWKWILSRGKIVAYDTDGTPLRMTGTSLDITERKQMEQALRESEERYRAIFNNAAVGINLSDRDTRFLQVNSRSASMLGYTQEELKALTVLDITHPDDREFSMANLSALIDGKIGSYRVQKRYVRRDGEVVWADVHVSAIHNRRGEFVANLAVIEDITDRKRAEQERERMRAQLLQAQKMEAIGTLTGGMAHEFNNLLTIVSGYAELLLSEKSESDPEHSDLKRIVHAAQRGAELVRSLLAFSRKSEMNFAPVNLNSEVEQVKKLLDRTLPKMIEIELNLCDGLKTVEADSGQIRQLLMNLALNARDAMPEGGKLSIGTNNLGEGNLSAPSGAKPGDYVQLTVSDTGIGMDGETLDRIFEPFYSTKGLAYKTGMGLAVVHGIIEQHGGYVRCDSKPEHGTTFQIYLPAAQPRKADSVSVKAQPLGGTETILIVDDEEYVRDLASRFLERAGYRVITAEDARMALGLCDKERSDISLVILDLIMPKIGGRQCLDELLKIDPRLKVLIASGYSDAENREELVRAGAKGFVGKPFHMTELLQALRDVLDAD